MVGGRKVEREVSLKFTTDGRQLIRDLREAARLSRGVATADRARVDAARAAAAEARAIAAEARAVAAQQKQESDARLQALKSEAQERKNAAQAQREDINAERDSIRLDRERRASQDAVNASIRAEGEALDLNQPKRTQLAVDLSIVRNSYLLINEAIQKVRQAGDFIFNNFIASNEELQKTLVETAAGIASTNQVFDSSGVPIEDAREAIERLLPGLEKARQEVVALAAGIPGVTESDIQPIFNALAQNVGQLGGDIEQIPELAANATAALTTFNIPLFQARQEINALIRGQIDQNAALATNLQIRKEDIELARQQGRLFEFLNEQFAGAAAGAGLLSDLTENSFSNIETILSRITREVGKPILEPVQQGLLFVSDLLSRLEPRILALVNTAQERARLLLPQAQALFNVILEQLEVVRRRLQPFFDSLRPLLRAIQDRLRAASETIKEVVGQLLESGLLEFLAAALGQALRIATEILTVSIRLGTFFTDALRPVLGIILGLLRPIVALFQVFLDVAIAITDAVTGIGDAFQGWIDRAQEGLNSLLRRLGATEAEIIRIGKVLQGLLTGDFGAESAEVEVRVKLAEQADLNRQLSAIAGAARQGLEIDTSGFDVLRDRIQAAFDPERAERMLAGLQAIEDNVDDTTEAVEEQSLALESLEEQRRQEELSRVEAFQDQLDAFALRREFRQDEINDIQEETRQLERQQAVIEGALEIQQALADLDVERGARRVSALVREQERLEAQLQRLRDEGASDAAQRRAQRDLDRNSERLAEAREQQARREFRLQQSQLDAQRAQIESQRVLNQLKVTQLETETEIARLNQEEQLAELQNQLETARREGGDPGKQRELERNIQNLQERLNDTIERQSTFADQRADFDRAARQQQTALDIQQQGAIEAFVEEFGQLLLENGDREAQRINDSNLSFAERERRLLELAQERSRVTIPTRDDGSNRFDTPASTQAPSQQANEENVEALLEQLVDQGNADRDFRGESAADGANDRPTESPTINITNPPAGESEAPTVNVTGPPAAEQAPPVVNVEPAQAPQQQAPVVNVTNPERPEENARGSGDAAIAQAIEQSNQAVVVAVQSTENAIRQRQQPAAGGVDLRRIERQLDQIRAAIPQPGPIGAAIRQNQRPQISQPRAPEQPGPVFNRQLEEVGS